MLEDRTAPAVASLSGDVLTIDFTATGTTQELVTVTNGGGNISLTGDVSGAVSTSVANVNRIVVTDSGGSTGQQVTFAGTQNYSLNGGLASTGVDRVSVTRSITATGTSTVDLNAPGLNSNFSGLAGIDISNATLSTVNGNIMMTGTGSAGTGATSRGVFLTSGAIVSAGGTGTVTVTGTGGASSGNSNYGVNVTGTNSTITSAGGDVSVTGIGGGTGASSSNYGVYVSSAGKIMAGGSGTVTVQGTGGATTGDANYGVIVQTTNSSITSSGGNVQVIGQGGGSSASTGQHGVFVTSAGRITAGGTGTVTVQGTGGATSDGDDFGVLVSGSSSAITSSGGNVSVTGTGGGSGSAPGNFGINVNSSGQITAGGSGTVTVQGNEGSGTTTNKTGLVVFSSGSIGSAGGAVQVNSSKDIHFSGGRFTANGATIQVNAGTGSLQPITTGIDVTASTLSFASNADLKISINGTVVDTLYSQLNVSGAIDLTGADLALTGFYTPALNDVFTIVSATSRSGFFNNLNDGATLTFNGVTMQIAYTATSVTLTAITSVTPPPLPAVFELSSLPSANHTIYLDFTGHTTWGTSWNNSWVNVVTPIYNTDGDPSNWSAAEQAAIQQVWATVAEDFAPFNVNVTTKEPTDLNDLIKSSTGDTRWGIRVAMSGSSLDWYQPGIGGVAFIGSFNFNTDTPTFSFSVSGDVVSHEVGHTVGLGHDGRTTPLEEYYAGHGSGPTSWEPIMGNGSRSVSQWSKGEYANASNTQDDLAIITTNNGFDYRIDDVGNTNATATGLSGSAPNWTGAGIIERNTDVDVFSFTVASAGSYRFTINPAAVAPNLDIQSQLFDADGTLLLTTNPAAALDGTFTTSLNAGTYYLHIDGVGTGDPTTGYTDYASLGHYSIVADAFVTTLTATLVDGNLTITDVDATGKNNQLTISTGGGNLIITDATEAFGVAPPGGTLSNANRTLTISLASITGSLTINGAGGNDLITLSALDPAFTASLVVNGGVGDDTVTLNGDVTFAVNADLDIDLQNDDSLPGVDVITLATNANILLSGTGTATLKASKNVLLNTGSSLITVDGALTVEANQKATATTGTFVGVDVNNALIQATGSGNVTVKGRGGDTAASQFGVQVRGGGDIIGGTAGATLTVNGAGGTSSGNGNYGVNVTGSGSTVNSSGANVSIIGTGGGSGASVTNYGVTVTGSATVTAGGSGSVSIAGTGGAASGNSNLGVNIGAVITSGGGNVSVIGAGGGPGSTGSNYGVFVFTNGQVTAGGNGSVTVQGTGGLSGNFNHGVLLSGTGANINSGGGNVSVTGVGGGSDASTSNFGVFVATGQITAGGTGSVTIQGTGGATTATSNIGVNVSGTSAVVTSGGGNVLITAIEGNSATLAALNVSTSGTITTAANGGNITLAADTMSISSPAVISSNASSTVTLKTRTPGRAISLGGGDSVSQLGLTDAELDRVTAGILQIGAADSGAVTVSAAITRPALATTVLTGGAAVNFSGGSFNTNGGDLNLAPGTSVGASTTGTDVTVGTLAFASGADLAIVINGTTVNTQYQQLNVAGTVNLTGVDLVLSGSHTPALGQTFTIVSNDSTDAIIGTFNGLPEGAFISNFLGSALSAQITYVGGTNGNDVVLTVMANQPGALADGGFESPALGAGAFQYAPSGSAWSFVGGAGLSGNGSAFTAGNPNAPQGGQVAFLQDGGSFSQVFGVAAGAGGSYTVSFQAAQRGNHQPGGNQVVRVLVDGVERGQVTPTGTSYEVFTTAAFALGEGAHTLTLQGLGVGDSTAFLDAVDVARVTQPAALADGGFESPALGAGVFQYVPSGSAWSFVGGAGLAGNASAFTAGNPNAPQGGQVAFLQDGGSFSQVFGVAAGAGGSYTVSFQAAQRGNHQPGGNQVVRVLVDGVERGQVTPTGTSYEVFTTAAFALGEGAHTLTLQGLGVGDSTAFLDAVDVARVTQPAALADGGFESPALGAGVFQYVPSGSAWSFVGGAGLAGNASAFTAGNPNAPQGGQVAFLQDGGSFSQVFGVAAGAGGSYTVSFQAAQRGNHQPGGNQVVRVLVDGVERGQVTPTGTSYEVFTTAAFALGEGAHTLTLQGLGVGDSTAFLDAVDVTRVG